MLAMPEQPSLDFIPTRGDVTSGPAMSVPRGPDRDLAGGLAPDIAGALPPSIGTGSGKTSTPRARRRLRRC
jgi:hypothetical protein